MKTRKNYPEICYRGKHFARFSKDTPFSRLNSGYRNPGTLPKIHRRPSSIPHFRCAVPTMGAVVDVRVQPLALFSTKQKRANRCAGRLAAHSRLVFKVSARCNLRVPGPDSLLLGSQFRFEAAGYTLSCDAEGENRWVVGVSTIRRDGRGWFWVRREGPRFRCCRGSVASLHFYR